MAFHSVVRGVWPFSGSLSDLANMNDFSGASSAEYRTWKRFDLAQNRNISTTGLKFTQSYSSDSTFNVTDSFTIAFWYYSPEVLGYTEHNSGTGRAPRQSPILAVGEQSVPGLTFTRMVVVATEIAASDDTNAILVRISYTGSGFSGYRAISESYLPGVHHVVLSFNKQTGRMRVDLDGRAGISSAAPTSFVAIPASNLYLNKIVVDYSSHVVTQSDAFISELVMLDTAAPYGLGLNHMRYGLAAVTDATKLVENYAYFGVGYPQESTVTTTGIFAEGENVFVTRSNGQILKGVTPIWDRQVEFQSEDDLNGFTLSPVGQATLIGSGLTLQETTIRV